MRIPQDAEEECTISTIIFLSYVTTFLLNLLLNLLNLCVSRASPKVSGHPHPLEPRSILFRVSQASFVCLLSPRAGTRLPRTEYGPVSFSSSLPPLPESVLPGAPGAPPEDSPPGSPPLCCRQHRCAEPSLATLSQGFCLGSGFPPVEPWPPPSVITWRCTRCHEAHRKK